MAQQDLQRAQDGAFTTWLEQNGIWCPKCDIAVFPGTGRGVVAIDDIVKDEVVVEVPEDLVLWQETASIADELAASGLCHGQGASVVQEIAPCGNVRIP